MKNIKLSTAPLDSSKRKKEKPVICYPKNNINDSNLSIYQKARKHLKITNEVIVPPRDAKCFEVNAVY